jgi:hypothetical protein
LLLLTRKSSVDDNPGNGVENYDSMSRVGDLTICKMDVRGVVLINESNEVVGIGDRR